MTAQVKKAATGLLSQSGRSTNYRISVLHSDYTPQAHQKSSLNNPSPRQAAPFAWEQRLPAWMCRYLWRRAMIGWVSVDALSYKLETAGQTIEWCLVEAGIQALGLERRT